MSIVTIVVPVYNNLFYTKNFLRSVYEHKTKHKLVVIVVDNGSDAETREYLEQESVVGLRINAIHNKQNLGFGPAVNQGIKTALQLNPDTHVLVTNNDIELLDNCVDELVAVLDEYEDAGIVGGKLLFPDGRIQHAGAFLSTHGWGQHIGGGMQDLGYVDYPIVRKMEYVTGALFLIANALVEKLGGFDERFAPAYFEEVDYCVSARAQGKEVYYTGKAQAIHHENVTGKQIYQGDMDKVNALSRTNQIKYYLKHDEDNSNYVATSDRQLLLSCKIYGAWSFTHVMRNLAKGLSRAGVDVSIAPEEYHQPWNVDDWEIKQMISAKPKDYWNRVVMRSSEGDHMYLMPPGKKRVAHTTGESTRITAGWRDQLNQVDQVLTTSRFFKEVMLNCGIQTPIYIVPNTVDTTLFTPEGPKLGINGLRGLNFLSMFHWGDRKNPEALVRAFAREFKPDEDVTLTVHSLSMAFVLQQQGLTPQQWLERVVGGLPHAPILLTSSDYFMDTYVPAFMRNFDVFVTTTRAEGFCLPLLEAAALGMPGIAPGYSGLTDILDDHTGWLTDYKLVDIPLQILPYFHNYIGGQWAEVNEDDFRAKMRAAYNDRSEVKRRGKNARERAQLYSIEAVGQLAADTIFDE